MYVHSIYVLYIIELFLLIEMIFAHVRNKIKVTKELRNALPGPASGIWIFKDKKQ